MPILQIFVGSGYCEAEIIVRDGGGGKEKKLSNVLEWIHHKWETGVQKSRMTANSYMTLPVVHDN